MKIFVSALFCLASYSAAQAQDLPPGKGGEILNNNCGGCHGLTPRLVQPPASDRWYAMTARGAVTAEEIRFDPFRVHTELSDLSGRAVVPRSFDDVRLVDRLDVRLVGRPLDLADVAPLAPSVPSKGQLHLDATARGDGDNHMRGIGCLM